MSAQEPSTALEHDLLLLVAEERVHAFDLTKLPRIGIGRHDSNDLKLRSRTVSNFHAEILLEEGRLVLRDLGSTNGTELNGERVSREALCVGDRIRVGNHTFALRLGPRRDAPEGSDSVESCRPGSRGRLLPLSSSSSETAATLADLLRRATTSRRSACIQIEREEGRAVVYVHDGAVQHAEYGGSVGEKALYRLFGWQEASYEVAELEAVSDLPVTICLPVDALLEEGAEHAMELGRLVARLPPLASRLSLKEDCPLPLRAHTHAEIEVFQEIIRHGTIEEVVSRSPLADVRVLRLIESLLKKGVFEVASLGSMDDTCQASVV